MLVAVQDPSPVFTLPCEITSEIFIHCLPTVSYQNREWNTANPHEAPMLLLHVCRTWREIAIGTLALWVNMELSMHNAHSHDLALGWLERAKRGPLYVKLHDWFGDENRFIPHFQTLLERARDIEVLELSTITMGPVYALDECANSRVFPSLRKLTIGVHDDINWASMLRNSCTRLFADAPLLRELRLIGFTIPGFLAALPWHQLTKYVHIDDLNPMDALRLGSNLIECVLSVEMIGSYYARLSIHSKLKSLTLSKDRLGRCESTDILRFLVLPALETLRIFDCRCEWFTDQEFQGFLTRSGAPLRELTIRLDPGTELDAHTELNVDAFLVMPTLVELEIWNPQKISIFFAHFANIAFLPLLQHLSFVHPCHSSIDVARRQLKTMQTGLSDRWNSRYRDPGPERLRSFSLVWDWDIGYLPEDVLVPLRAMASEGLSISLKSPTRSYI